MTKILEAHMNLVQSNSIYFGSKISEQKMEQMNLVQSNFTYFL